MKIVIVAVCMFLAACGGRIDEVAIGDAGLVGNAPDAVDGNSEARWPLDALRLSPGAPRSGMPGRDVADAGSVQERGSCAWGKGSGGSFPLCAEIEGPAELVARVLATCESVSTNEWSAAPCERGPAVIGGCVTRGEGWSRTDWISPLYEPWRTEAYRAADLETRRAACEDGGGTWVSP